MYVFYNADIITDEKSSIHMKDRGFLLGDGIFETIKTHNGDIVFFDDHYSRLTHSAKILSIPVPYSSESLKQICIDLLEKNNQLNSQASIRITLTRGVGERGIKIPSTQNPTILVTASKLDSPKNIHPSTMITSVKRNQYSPIIHHKTLNYLESILARKEANTYGFDEGIMLNIDGFITESTVANIFFVKDGSVITPPITSGILPGIIRQKVIDLCKVNRISIIEKNISPLDIYEMDEAFQTNSLIGVQPLTAIGDKKFCVEQFRLTNMIAKLYETIILEARTH